MSEKNGGQVVLEVGREEEITDANGSEALIPFDSASPEISSFTSKRESFNRSVDSVLSKRKSTFGEQSVPTDSNIHVETRLEQVGESSPYGGSISKASSRPVPNSSALRSTASMNKKVFISWILFLCILGVLVASFTVEKLDKLTIWGVEFWKWSVLAMVIYNGMFVANWFMEFMVYASKRKKMLYFDYFHYFVHGMKQCVQVLMWSGMLLLTWLLLFDHGIKRSENSPRKNLHYVTRSLISVLIAAVLWSLKTLSLKILALRYCLHTFFDRTQESIFHQHVIQTLSGPPPPEHDGIDMGKLGEENDGIDMGKLLNMKLKEFSASTMEELVDAVSSSAGLASFSYTSDGKKISSKMEADAAASHIFNNVAPRGSRYIEKEDLMRFMNVEEVKVAFMLIDIAQTGHIDRLKLTDWVVKVYKARKGLIHSLTDTKKAVKQLDKLVTSILIVISIVAWLLLVEIATTKVLVFLSSQIVLAAFIFGNTGKNIFEAVVFVFVMHPFHVGDDCLVDGHLLTVVEMNILTTVFSTPDNDKVYYPNSVLSTLPISNCKDNSQPRDVVEFSIAFAPVEKIGILKERIKQYIDGKSQYLHPNHNVAVFNIEKGNTLSMALYFSYILQSRDFGEKELVEKANLRSGLIIQLMTILEELNITSSVQS